MGTPAGVGHRGGPSGLAASLGLSPLVSLRARRAAEPVGLGAAAAGAAPRAAGPGLTLEPLLCALARAGQLGAPYVLVRAVVGAGEHPCYSLARTVLAGSEQPEQGWLPSTSPRRVLLMEPVGVLCRPQEERQRLLQGTGVPEAVEKDLANIRSEYYSIVLPFMEAHPDLFSPRVRSLELYHQLVALVMAYRSVSRA